MKKHKIRSADLTRPDPPKSGKIVTWPDPTRPAGPSDPWTTLCWITYLVSVTDTTTNFDRFIGSWNLLLNFLWLLHWCKVGWTIVIVFFTHCRSRLQLLKSVLNSTVRLIRGVGRFDHITPVLIDLHWPPYSQHISYRICLLMFKCLKGLAPAYPQFEVILLYRDTGQSGVQGLLLWLVRNVGFRDLSVGPETFARNLKTHLFKVGFSD